MSATVLYLLHCYICYMLQCCNSSLTPKGALTHRLKCLTAWKIRNGRQGAWKWRTGSRKGIALRFWCYGQIFLNKFSDFSGCSMRKVVMEIGRNCNGKEENKDKNSGSLTLLPVGCLKGDRLQRRPLLPIVSFCMCFCFVLCTDPVDHSGAP